MRIGCRAVRVSGPIRIRILKALPTLIKTRILKGKIQAKEASAA
jgi:hypothetical protein